MGVMPVGPLKCQNEAGNIVAAVHGNAGLDQADDERSKRCSG